MMNRKEKSKPGPLRSAAKYPTKRLCGPQIANCKQESNIKSLKETGPEN